MSSPHFRYHEQKESWQAFDRDYEKFDSDRKSYKNIKCRPETRTWIYKTKGEKEITRKSLDEIVIVKAEQEELRKAKLLLTDDNQVHNV
jgi:hypothetical protein